MGCMKRRTSEIKSSDLIFCKLEEYISHKNIFQTMDIDRTNLTIMGVDITELDTLASTANAMGSNMFEGL